MTECHSSALHIGFCVLLNLDNLMCIWFLFDYW